MKRILITGANSYIGTSFEKWMAQYHGYMIDTVDTKNGEWKRKNYSGYDAVFHVAGIAHVDAKKVMEKLYYKVNRDLTIKIAKKAKRDGVKQFIFMSSIIVYGESNSVREVRYITKKTIPEPTNFYGMSKLQAEQGILPLQDDNFNVVILRPPMIYGPGSKGNYRKLSKLARICPVFPDIENKKSLLFIDNLCEFVHLMIENGEKGLFYPQNREYVSTFMLVKEIGRRYGHKVRKTILFNPFIYISSKYIKYFNKVFGSMVYDCSISEIEPEKYIVADFPKSIRLTERENSYKKIMLIGNHDIVIYNFRRELIERLLSEKYEVYIVLPYGEKVDSLIEMGCKFIDVSVDRRGRSIIKDLYLIRKYLSIMNEVKPDVVLTYTIKPNIYAGLICRIKKISYITNITGLGSAVENNGILQNLTSVLYRISVKNASCIFFQNEENREFFINKKMVSGKQRLIPGSGVNLDEFNILDYPSDDVIEFLFIGRVMKEKGIEEYLKAAKVIRKRYPNTMFHVLGFCEEEYENRLKTLQNKNIIKYHGLQSDVKSFLEKCHCTILPSYYPEGISNVLLESAASGRPVITTDRSGCRETVDDGMTGYIFRAKEVKQLIYKVEQFINLSNVQKKEMGLLARKKVEDKFDRKIVIEAYMDEVKSLRS